MTLRRGVERARDEWADVERRIRQRMRIYPQKQKTAKAAAVDLDEPELSHSGAATGKPKPIVSIHGRDLRES
ncbi:MAG TPA: hypothetical protein VKL99_15095 [Candidatus Angelobacter sp.]|nr:hypothetical protein [Candidatus Angelobacter sp.]